MDRQRKSHLQVREERRTLGVEIHCREFGAGISTLSVLSFRCRPGGTADAQTSNQERSSPDPVPVKVRMNNAVELLKDGGSDILEQVRVVSEDIAKQYLEASDRKLRQDYGDHLAEIGAAGQLTKLLRRLMDLGMETKIGWIGIELVRNVFWNYCDASLKMAKAVARQGVLSIMLGDLDRLGPKQSRNEVRHH